MEAQTEATKERTLIEIIAETNPSLARILAMLEPDKLHGAIAGLFSDAASGGEDDEAARTFEWYVISERERISEEIKQEARTFAAHSLSCMRLSGCWFSEPLIPKATAMLAEALARGTFSEKTEEGADQYFTVLIKNFRVIPAYRDIILAALKKATGKGAPRKRLLKFIAFEHLPEEMRRVLLNALMRNSEDTALAKAFEIVSLLEDCDESALLSVKNLAERVAAFDGVVRNLKQTIAMSSSIIRTGKVDTMYVHEGMSVRLRIDLHVSQSEGEGDGDFYQRVGQFHAATRDMIQSLQFGSQEHQYASVSVKLYCRGVTRHQQTAYVKTFEIR